MRKIKWFGVVAILLCISGLSFLQILPVKETSTQSTCFPDFTITINGSIFSVKHNQENAMFPLFLYHDIVYYPITDASKKLLNLQEVKTNSEDEIVLCQADIPIIEEYIPETIAPPNPENFQRNLSSVIKSNKTLKINGTIIAAPNMDYPLLEYAFITYMPITSELIVKQLHGRYYFDTTGLEITTVSDDLLYHVE